MRLLNTVVRLALVVALSNGATHSLAAGDGLSKSGATGELGALGGLRRLPAEASNAEFVQFADDYAAEQKLLRKQRQQQRQIAEDEAEAEAEEVAVDGRRGGSNLEEQLKTDDSLGARKGGKESRSSSSSSAGTKAPAAGKGRNSGTKAPSVQQSKAPSGQSKSPGKKGKGGGKKRSGTCLHIHRHCVLDADCCGTMTCEDEDAEEHEDEDENSHHTRCVFATARPTAGPTELPSAAPSGPPTAGPSAEPSDEPTFSPSDEPSESPSDGPSSSPSVDPSAAPSNAPSVDPSAAPSNDPSNDPSVDPSAAPSNDPSVDPSAAPSNDPSVDPSDAPSDEPSMQPSDVPSNDPSSDPSDEPSSEPTPTCAQSGDMQIIPAQNVSNSFDVAFGTSFDGTPFVRNWRPSMSSWAAYGGDQGGFGPLPPGCQVSIALAYNFAGPTIANVLEIRVDAVNGTKVGELTAEGNSFDYRTKEIPLPSILPGSVYTVFLVAAFGPNITAGGEGSTIMAIASLKSLTLKLSSFGE